MLVKRWMYLLPCLLVLLFVVPTFAQDVALSQRVQLPENYAISIPEDWMVGEDEELGGTLLEGITARARAITPALLEELTDIDAGAPLTDVLVSLYRDFAAERARESDIETLILGEYTAASYRFTTEDAEGLFIVIDFGAGAYGMFEFVVPLGQLDGQLQLAKSIVATFTDSSVIIDPTTGLPQQTTLETNADNAAQCTVSTTEEGIASLHVGPGYNRAIVSFLPPGGEYRVTGSFIVEDGGEWFQLDKSEIPAAAVANEIWVPRELVDTQGNCDSVADASAPPIVPNVNIPVLHPTTDPGTPMPVPATPVPVEGGLVPLDGTWTMTFAPTTPVSCLNTETVHIDSSQLWNTEPFVSRMTVAPDGSSFAYGADTFTRTAPSTYGGSFTFDDGSNAQVRFDVISGSQMVGQVVYNENVNGRPCSATGTLYVNRN